MRKLWQTDRPTDDGSTIGRTDGVIENYASNKALHKILNIYKLFYVLFYLRTPNKNSYQGGGYEPIRVHRSYVLPSFQCFSMINWIFFIHYRSTRFSNNVPTIKLVHQYCTKPSDLEWFMSISQIVRRKTESVLIFLLILTFHDDF